LGISKLQDQAMLEHTITQCSNDNLELGWRLIEKVKFSASMISTEHSSNILPSISRFLDFSISRFLAEKAATEKAMRDIDETLSNAIQVRRRHREQTGQKYVEGIHVGGWGVGCWIHVGFLLDSCWIHVGFLLD
jgi:hypothetical protein